MGQQVDIGHAGRAERDRYGQRPRQPTTTDLTHAIWPHLRRASTSTSTSTRVALSAMHVVLGVVVVLTLQSVWRSGAGRKSASSDAG